MKLLNVHGTRLVYANGKYLGIYYSSGSKRGTLKRFNGKDGYIAQVRGTKTELELIIAEHYRISPFELKFHYYRPAYASDIDEFEFC